MGVLEKPVFGIREMSWWVVSPVKAQSPSQLHCDGNRGHVWAELVPGLGRRGELLKGKLSEEVLEALGISKYTREKGVTWRTHCGHSGNSLVPSDLETLKSSMSSQEKGGCKKRAEALPCQLFYHHTPSVQNSSWPLVGLRDVCQENE